MDIVNASGVSYVISCIKLQFSNVSNKKHDP